MGSKRLVFIAPAMLFLGLFAVAGYYLIGGKDPRALPSALIDRPVPVFRLAALSHDGGAVRPALGSEDFTGKVTIVNFFASWCTPCLVEHPQITALSRVDGLSVVGINYKNKPVQAVAWLQRHGNPYTRIGVDPAGEVAIDFGLYGVPETFLIDRKGHIRLKHVGPVTPAVLRDKIMPAVRALLKP